MGCGSSRTNEDGPKHNHVAKPPVNGKFFSTEPKNKTSDSVLEKVFYGSLKKEASFFGGLYNSDKELDNLRDLIAPGEDDLLKNKKVEIDFEKFKVVAIAGTYVNKVTVEKDSYYLHATKDTLPKHEYVALLVHITKEKPHLWQIAPVPKEIPAEKKDDNKKEKKGQKDKKDNDQEEKDENEEEQKDEKRNEKSEDKKQDDEEGNAADVGEDAGNDGGDNAGDDGGAGGDE